MVEVPELLEKLLSGTRLSEDEAYEVAAALTSPDALTEAQKAALLTALRAGKETPEELSGFVKAMLDKAVKVGPFPDAIDTAGTGGDKASLFNVSTAAGIALAALGYKVAKHGNRGVTSVTGSADILEMLGYNINMEPEKAEEALEKSNFVFLFAPRYHPAMKNVAKVRKELGIRTIFNLAGPLSNPARVRYQVVGVSKPWMLDVMAKALKILSVKRAAVVHVRPGIDEVSPTSTTEMMLVNEDEITYTVIDVNDFGAKALDSLDPLRVKTPEESKEKFLRALRGEGPEAIFLGVNAAIALHVIEPSIDVENAYIKVVEALVSGDALEKLREAIEASGGKPRF